MTAKVIPFPRLPVRPIPERLLQDVLGGRYRGDWTAHDYLVAVRELYHYGVVETPGLYEAEAIRDMALVPVTIEGDGRRWFVRRMREVDWREVAEAQAPQLQGHPRVHP